MGLGANFTRNVKAARTFRHPACLKIARSPPLQWGGMICQLPARRSQAVAQQCSDNPLIRDRKSSSEFSLLTLEEGVKVGGHRSVSCANDEEWAHTDLFDKRSFNCSTDFFERLTLTCCPGQVDVSQSPCSAKLNR